MLPTSPLGRGGLIHVAAAAISVASCSPSTTNPDLASSPPLLEPPQAVGAFKGSVVLGTPTSTTITANVYAVDQAGAVSIQYGTSASRYSGTTPPVALRPDVPVAITVSGLAPDTRYFYRLQYDGGGTGSGPTAEASFHTARARGRTFRFGLQGDSHPERLRTQFDATLYERTLRTAAADSLDFYVMLGDDFSVDILDPTTVTERQVRDRYTLQRPWLGIVGAMSPIYLVNGNHEQAARYLLDGSPSNVAVWAQNARNTVYAQPAPDGFYSGNAEQVPHIGLLRNFYAFEWGDALFVMIDPYWGSPVCVDNPFFGGDKRSDLWSITHGDAQYQWLKTTLERSTARYKFVFAHHVLGTRRGGADIARQYEWGGQAPNGVDEFRTRRPTWAMPIHQLFVANRVTAFFQGHDHIWVRQQLDGVVYQTLSEPADPNYSLFNADAFEGGVELPNSGYTRVTVGAAGVKVEYVRTYRQEDEGAARTSGSVAYSYTIP